MTSTTDNKYAYIFVDNDNDINNLYSCKTTRYKSWQTINNIVLI